MARHWVKPLAFLLAGGVVLGVPTGWWLGTDAASGVDNFYADTASSTSDTGTGELDAARHRPALADLAAGSAQTAVPIDASYTVTRDTSSGDAVVTLR